MFADIVILVFLAAIVGAIYFFVTSQSSAASAKGKTNKSALDLQNNQFNLKTNARPLSQQELIDKAQVRADAGRRYIAKHTDSLSFGKKDNT